MWHEIVTVVPLASLPAWQARGWAVLDNPWTYGVRGEGPQVRVWWAGVGEVPYPTGWER